MENQIQIFEHEQFGKIRTVIIDGRIHFVAVDVCRALDIKNPSDILKRLDDDEKTKIPESRVVVDPILNIGSENREVNVVNEPGLYRLIFSSRKKEALNFQRWVYHEVLPSIRQTGSYSVVKKTKPAPNSKRREGQLSDARVYVFKMSDGTVQIVKIGQSKNIRARAAKIKRDTGLSITNIYFTPLMSREDARLVEWACQEIFSSCNVNGEFFSVKFEEACAAIDSFVQMVATRMITSEKQQLLVNSAKLIAGRKFD